MQEYSIGNDTMMANTVLAYAGASLRKPHPETPTERIVHLSNQLNIFNQQLITEDRLTVWSYEAEEDLLALVGAAENYIETQYLICMSTEALSDDKNTKRLRKDAATVKAFKEAISTKGKETIWEFYIRNGIDDDILFDEVLYALQSPHLNDGTSLIGDQLRTEIKSSLLKLVREKLKIREYKS